MKTLIIDINCDVGEGIGSESELMPLISSCNIACGGHSGNFDSMSKIARLANEQGVRVGAHPSYPDRKNFGRTSIKLPKSHLIESIQTQIDGFNYILTQENIPLHHIKAHGALYNDIARDPELAETFLEAIADYKKNVFLYAPFQSAIAEKGEQRDFQIKFEAFADRNYNADLSLISRKLPKAVINKPEDVLEHLLGMVKKGQIKTLDGARIPIQAETFCVHGDTPTALQILNYLSEELPKANIQIKK